MNTYLKTVGNPDGIIRAPPHIPGIPGFRKNACEGMLLTFIEPFLTLR